MAKKRASRLDIHLGRRLRSLRKERGLSLMEAGEIVGVTQQQVSRLERAENVMTARHLYRFARGLGVPVSWFYEGYVEDPDEIKRLKTVLDQFSEDWTPATPREMDELLLKAWHALRSKVERERVLAMIEGFAFKV